jgi:gamma-glutamylcyclotransferase (GGCT)/AIG2-like uncharacterized protein YtfP
MLWVEISWTDYEIMTDTKLYFGYGSNMDREDWARWCSDHGAKAAGLIEIGPAWLPDYTLKFHYFSSNRKSGAADVVPGGRGSVVPGLLFEVDEETLAALDDKEGLPYAYERKNVTVIDENGSLKQAITYIVQKHRYSGEYEQPDASYVDLIQRNLLRNNLPIDNLNYAIEDLHDKKFLNSVFVYGTLRRGESRSNIMTEAADGSMEHATVCGTLYDHGMYPGLRTHGNGTVSGELYRCHDIAYTLKRLDEIEGFPAYDGPEGLYHRAVVNVTIGSEQRWAWTYITNLPTPKDSIIESGNWLER